MNQDMRESKWRRAALNAWAFVSEVRALVRLFQRNKKFWNREVLANGTVTDTDTKIGLAHGLKVWKWNDWFMAYDASAELGLLPLAFGDGDGGMADLMRNEEEADQHLEQSLAARNWSQYYF